MEKKGQDRRILSIMLSAILTLAFVGFACSTPRPRGGKSTSRLASLIQDKQELAQGVHMLFVDAGSSGSKVVAFGQKETGVKLLTQCTDDHVKNGRTNKGVASLAYTKDECAWRIGTKSDELKPLDDPHKYAEELLQLLFNTYKGASGSGDVTKVKNGRAVPILGTAGMRLLSKADNQKVWDYLCGKSHANLTIAQAGDRCGTIPGTTEAYYEYLANAVAGKSKELTGTFTIGGASAQIAIPLKTHDDVTAFNNLRSKIVSKIDCTKLQLPNGEQVPYFNTILKGGPKKECVDDYITFRPKEEIVASDNVEQNNIQSDQIEGVGLISFLGLRGSGTFLAGGVNEIDHWAEKAHCNTKETTFDQCATNLQAALDQDILFSGVREYFQSNALDIKNFSYNTYAAFPKAMGMKHVHGSDMAWDLKRELATECSKDNSLRFGYKGQNSCMKALFTSLFVTSFFDKRSSGGGHHDSKDLTYEPQHAGWGNGFIEEAAVRDPDRRLSAPALINSLPSIHLSRRSSSFLDGARIHHHGSV